MRELVTSLAIAILMAATGPALAQDTAAEGTSETAAPAASDPTLSMGEEIPQDQVGQVYVKDTYGDWQYRCVRAPEGQEDPCQIYQLLKDDTGNSVAEISIFPLKGEPNAAAGATIVTPLETLLTQKLRLAVDGGNAKRYDFAWCSAVGCFARIGLTADDVQSFKRGAAATLSINPVAAPDQEVRLKISLDGFTAAYEALMADAGQ